MINQTSAPALPGDPALAARLRGALQGEVLFTRFDRGRYSTDASIYQIEPTGIVLPRTDVDLQAALTIAREAGVSVLPRGAGTSQAGQTVGSGLVIDCSRHLRRIEEVDTEENTVWVEPGVVLDELNRHLRPLNLFFPVDISTSSRATLGGMAGNNACGARSLRYGIMVDNLLAIDALLADGSLARFAHVPPGAVDHALPERYRQIVLKMRALAEREADAIAGLPRLQRRVGGYNLDRIDPAGHNMASLLVGSEGTLALFRRLKLQLQPLPAHRVLGVCHFPSFDSAMTATEAIVALGPSAVELVDRTIIDLGRKIPAYRPLIERFVKGEPQALLLVEFQGDALDPLKSRLAELGELMADRGLPASVLEAIRPADQARIWDVRKAGLNIIMSMKGDGKPVSFIEDCAVPLAHLADYTAALNELFRAHGTSGTWYAHASVGTLHVRPILNLKQDQDVKAMRAIAEAATDLIRRYKGSHSGEHGDGIVRSEFHEKMFGPRLVRAFEEVKDVFDPDQVLNPKKIVRAPKMDDRRLFRFLPGYQEMPLKTALAWRDPGGFLGAAEMCNNNGACRKALPGVMCPSFRVTAMERDSTRGRANSLRLALSGQLGSDALSSDEMAETLDLCVSCKACRRECPTGIDMARMKIEVLHQRRQRHGSRWFELIIAGLPHYASAARHLRHLLQMREAVPGIAWLAERTLGVCRQRSLPRFARQPYRPRAKPAGMQEDGKNVVLFADTFTTWFEPENARAAARVLTRAGYRIHHPATGRRPLCCGRTYLAAGMIDRARAEAKRLQAALAPFVEQGLPVIGLEPSCLLTMRDEFSSLLPEQAAAPLAKAALLLEEFLHQEVAANSLALAFRPAESVPALVHGHCHQKAFGAMESLKACLDLVPGLNSEMIESSCCGMAGAFGYEARHRSASVAMAELSLMPKVRAAAADSLIIANGTSCRHQIHDLSGRQAVHLACLLDGFLA